MKELNIKITFTEDVLGSLPADPQIYKKFIASQSPDASTAEEEIAAIGVQEYIEKSMTVFARTPDNVPAIYDYQMRGFFKEMCGIIKKISGTESAKITANKKLIDNYVFVTPRLIPINLNGGEVMTCQRPLRGQTAQGERISIAISEAIPAGATAEFTVTLVLDSVEGKKGKESIGYVKALTEWLDYGKLKSFGQWRNSGKGRFTYEIIES